MAREPEAKDRHAGSPDCLHGLVQHIGNRTKNFFRVMLDMDAVPERRRKVLTGLEEDLPVRADDHGLGRAASLIDADETTGWHMPS